MHAFGRFLGRGGREGTSREGMYGVRSSLLVGTPRYISFSPRCRVRFAGEKKGEEGGGLFRHPQYLNNRDCGKKSEV